VSVLKKKARERSATVRGPKGEAKYPIPDKSHARNALARINQAKPPLTPAQKAKVRAKANRVLGRRKSR